MTAVPYISEWPHQHKVRAEEFTGDTPPEEQLPERPRQHLGVIRRPIPISKLQRTTKSLLAKAIREFQERAMRILDRAGALEFAAEDANRDEETKRASRQFRQQFQWKAPIGRGGHPLGLDAMRELRAFFNASGVDFMSRLLVSEVRNWQLELEAILGKQALAAYNLGGQGARATLGVRGAFKLRNPFIVDSLRDRANLLAGGIADDTFERLKTVFAEGFYVAGESPLEVAKTLRGEFDFLARDRSELVARTEGLVITSQGQQTLYKASGVEFKRWLTTLDGLERLTHFEAHGQIVPIDQPFLVGDEEMQHPGDPSADIKEVANCRCAHIAVVSASQVFSEANVWAGDVAPDQFSQERLQEAA